MTDHHIEEGVRVYLDYVAGQWKVSSSTVDGCALDSTRDAGASCDYSHETPEEQGECDTILNQADKTWLPTATELIPLIAEHLATKELIFVIRDLTRVLGDRNG